MVGLRNSSQDNILQDINGLKACITMSSMGQTAACRAQQIQHTVTSPLRSVCGEHGVYQISMLSVPCKESQTWDASQHREQWQAVCCKIVQICIVQAIWCG